MSKTVSQSHLPPPSATSRTSFLYSRRREMSEFPFDRRSSSDLSLRRKCCDLRNVLLLLRLRFPNQADRDRDQGSHTRSCNLCFALANDAVLRLFQLISLLNELPFCLTIWSVFAMYSTLCVLSLCLGIQWRPLCFPFLFPVHPAPPSFFWEIGISPTKDRVTQQV